MRAIPVSNLEPFAYNCSHPITNNQPSPTFSPTEILIHAANLIFVNLPVFSVNKLALEGGEFKIFHQGERCRTTARERPTGTSTPILDPVETTLKRQATPMDGRHHGRGHPPGTGNCDNRWRQRQSMTVDRLVAANHGEYR